MKKSSKSFPLPKFGRRNSRKDTQEACLEAPGVSQPSTTSRSHNGYNGLANGATGGHDMETDSVPETPRRYEAEVEKNEDDPLRSHPCNKNPGHIHFKSLKDLKLEDLPRPFNRDEMWLDFLHLKAMETVKLTVNHTNGVRPESLGFREYARSNTPRLASGTAFLLNMGNSEPCTCSEVRGPHRISGSFFVMTAAHVVYDDQEAVCTLVEFFYDSDDDAKRCEIVKAKGERVKHINVDKNMVVIECRTHDLSLYDRLEEARRKREELTKKLQKKVVRDTTVVLISHPHGLAKHVSFGNLKDVKEVGDVKTNSDGMELIGCTLSYTTPTCPGAGGGSINVIGGGDVCLAFAPHCASKGADQNISGLGWAKYPVPWNSPLMGNSTAVVEIRNMSCDSASASSVSSDSLTNSSASKYPDFQVSHDAGGTESF